MSNTKTKKRIIYLDYLRVLAIFGVLINHISAIWEDMPFIDGPIAIVYNAFGRIGVPLFLMLTGILLLNNRLTIKDFIKRRYHRVIIPFLFWMTLLILYTLFILNPDLLNGNIINYAIEQYLSGRWYVWMILGVYLVIPIFASFIKGTKLEGVKYFLILWIITTALISLSIIFNFSMHYLDLVIFSGPIGYLMLGYYLHNNEINISAKKIVIISLIVFVLISFIKALILKQDAIDPYSFRYFIFTMKSRLEIDTVSIIQVTSLFLVVKYIPKVGSGFYQKITAICNKKIILMLVISISQASYGIYLNHYFIINSLKVFYFPFTSFPSIIFVPLFSIIILLLAYSIIIILNKVPIINKLTGYH